MTITEIYSRKNLLHFLGKLPQNIEKFAFKERLMHKMLEKFHEKQTLEIVPNFYNQRDIDCISFTARHSSGFYLNYSGTNEYGFGVGPFYIERLECSHIKPVMPANDFNILKETFSKEFNVIKQKFPNHVPSPEEYTLLQKTMDNYYEAMETLPC